MYDNTPASDGGDGGPATSAPLVGPGQISQFTGADTRMSFINNGDSGGVRHVNNGVISTLLPYDAGDIGDYGASTAAYMNTGNSVLAVGTNVYVTTGSCVIRRIDMMDGKVYPFAGTICRGSFGDIDGENVAASSATLSFGKLAGMFHLYGLFS